MLNFMPFEKENSSSRFRLRLTENFKDFFIKLYLRNIDLNTERFLLQIHFINTIYNFQSETVRVSILMKFRAKRTALPPFPPP